MMFTTNGYHIDDIARTASRAFHYAVSGTPGPEWDMAIDDSWTKAAAEAVKLLDIPVRDQTTRKVEIAEVVRAMRGRQPESIGWEAAARHVFNLLQSRKATFERQRETLERRWADWAKRKAQPCPQN